MRRSPDIIRNHFPARTLSVSLIAVTLVVIVVVVLTLAMRIAWRFAGARRVDLV